METQSWEFEKLSADTRESGPTPTTVNPTLAGPEPVEPPRRPRPDPASLGPTMGSTPISPSIQTPEPADPSAAAAPLIASTPGWGWRAFVAFVAGGVLTAGGFAVGQLSADDTETTRTDVVPASAPIPRTTTPVVPRTVSPDLSDTTSEPAELVAQLLGPSVVQINTNTGIGSGVIYGDGLILTNNHVIEGSDEVTVQLSDGRHLTGTVLGSDPNADIAVVSVGEGLDLPIAELATGEKAQVGQTAIAIGSPFRLQQTVTEGIVSAVDRPIPSGQVYTAMIQTDAPINPGNSGGALADRFGRVIGINTAIQTGGSTTANAGVGFAVPIDTAISVADRIVAGVPIEAGFLGVEGGPSTDGSAGVELTDVDSGTAADQAGLQVGDRILSIDGAPVTAFEELAGLVVARQPGEVVALEVVRDGRPLTIEVTLGTR